MKKIYEKPILNIDEICLEDVLTISGAEDGIGTEFDFENLEWNDGLF